jgi:hypothetical protein
MLEEQPYPELIIVILEPFGCLWAILIRSTAVRTYGQGFQKITLRAVPVYLEPSDVDAMMTANEICGCGDR